MSLRKVMSGAFRQSNRINGSRLLSQASDAVPQEEHQTQNLEKTMNQVMLLGRVGAEPQKRGSTEHPVVLFSVATHTNYKYDSGETVQRTDWHKVCVFRPALRDTIYNYMKKGQRVLVKGKLYYGEIKDEEGKPRPTTSIIAEEIVMFQS